MKIHPLAHVGIDGFRGLRGLKLEGLSRVNVLVGDNSSGKTSVLEALSLMCQPYNPDEWLSMIGRRDFGRLDETRLLSLRWCFPQSSNFFDPEILFEAECNFVCDGAFPLRSLRVKYKEFLGEPSPEEMRRHLRLYSRAQVDVVEPMRGGELSYYPDWCRDRAFGTHQSLLFDETEGVPALRVWEHLAGTRINKRKRGPHLDVEVLTPYSYQINRIQVRTHSKQILRSDIPQVLDLLRDFDQDVEGIELASFYGERPALYIKHRKLGFAPLSVFGDAMRRSALLAATLPSLRGGLLLVDEIEVGIHVGALGRIFRWLVDAAKALDVQVVATTHSLEALDALLAAGAVTNDGDIVAFHLTQTPEKTECKRYSGELLHRLRFERGLDVR